jgi:hypothetical protein
MRLAPPSTSILSLLLFPILATSVACDPDSSAEKDEPAPETGGALLVPEQYATIGEAIDAAVDGDTIILAPGEYAERVDFAGKGITIRSTDPDDPAIVDQTIIAGDGGGCTVTFQSGEDRDSILEGVSLRGARANHSRRQEGGAVCVYAGTAPVLRGNAISDNDAGNGAAVIVVDAAPRIENNRIHDNTSGHLGAALFVSEAADVEILGNAITGNTGGSGAIKVTDEESNALIEGNTVADNETEFGVGGIEISYGASAVIAGNTITGNVGHGDSFAGGISVIRAIATIEANEITANEKVAGTGGAGVTIIGHHTRDASARLEGNTISDNVNLSGSGGGVSVTYNASAVIEDNVIVGNETAAWGGGIFAYNLNDDQDGEPHTIEIRDNEIRDNRITGLDAGGGISVRGPAIATIENNLISGNVASTDPTLAGFRAGGGIAIQLNRAIASIYDNTIEHNSAAHRGGGIFVGLDSRVLDRAGEDWPRAHSGPFGEPNNTYTGNLHGDDCGNDVFFQEVPCNP